jgi:hypothetical protein
MHEKDRPTWHTFVEHYGIVNFSVFRPFFGREGKVIAKEVGEISSQEISCAGLALDETAVRLQSGELLVRIQSRGLDFPAPPLHTHGSVVGLSPASAGPGLATL